MIERGNEMSRQTWARIAGFLYLFTNVTAILAFYISGQVIAKNDAARTAANMAASESWFRLGMAAELVTVAGVIGLIAALYAMLRPVDRNLALLAALLRLVENCTLVAITLSTLTALTLLRSAEFMRGSDGAQLEGLIYAFLRAHGYGFQIGFLFLGLGSAVFSYLWLKSRYIPWWLAALGIFASLVMALAALAIIVWPSVYDVITMAYMAPMGLYEYGLGFWLLFARLRLPGQHNIRGTGGGEEQP